MEFSEMESIKDCTQRSWGSVSRGGTLTPEPATGYTIRTVSPSTTAHTALVHTTIGTHYPTLVNSTLYLYVVHTTLVEGTQHLSTHNMRM